MAYPDSADIAVEVLGGYCPAIPPSDLPAGASPDCQDVMFPEAAVRTRDGAEVALAQFAGGPAQIAGVADFVNGQTVPFLLIWSNSGSLYQWDYNTNVASLINGALGSADCQMSSTSIFGRKYLAFASTADRTPAGASVGNDGGGIDFPRQWDGTNYDRVGQIGPGAAPTVSDNTTPIDNVELEQFSSSISVLIQQADSNMCWAYLPANTFLPGGSVTPSQVAQANDVITIGGATPSGFNGTFPVLGVIVIGETQIIEFTNPNTGLGTASVPGTLYSAWTFAEVGSDLPANPQGLSLTISGATPTGYNGTWPIRYGFASATVQCWIYVGTTQLANASGADAGAAPPPGNITAGLHGLTVAFITRQNYVTAPAPPIYWTAAGSLQAAVASIAIGPSNIIARLLLFTEVIEPPATTGTFFSIEEPVTINGVTYSTALLIADNTTTSLTVDFRDSDLAAGFNGQYLFNQIELGECAGVTSYADRTVWTGERNRIRNILNTSFNGGWNLGGGTGSSDLPLGWTSDPTYGAGGSRLANGGVWLDAYQVAGSGSGNQGMITQPAYEDYLGVQIFGTMGNGTHSVRMRAKVPTNAGGTTGSVVVDIYSPTGGGILAKGSVNVAQLTANYAILTTPLATSGWAGGTLPADAVFRLYGQGIPTGTNVAIDEVQFFPTAQPVNHSVAWLSYAENPEAFDGVTGQITIRNNDGQTLRQTFTIRGNLYLGKDRYLASTADDATNEPALWQVNEVSSNIGIAGPNAVATAEEYAIFANRNGAYIYWGSEPIKISQEIQEDAIDAGRPCWDALDPNQMGSIWAAIDTQRRQFLFGVPQLGKGAFQVFMMDAKFLPGAESIAGAPAPSYSAFTGKMLEHGSARKWAPWTPDMLCCTLSERPDGTAALVFAVGSGGNGGKIYQIEPGQTSDDGAAIDSYYTAYGMPSDEEAQMLQMGNHRHLYDYLTGRAGGNGTLGVTLETDYRTVAVRGVALSAAPLDFERKINVSAERMYVTVGTNAAGEWFRLEKLVAMIKPEPVTPLRGIGP